MFTRESANRERARMGDDAENRSVIKRWYSWVVVDRNDRKDFSDIMSLNIGDVVDVFKAGKISRACDAGIVKDAQVRLTSEGFLIEHIEFFDGGKPISANGAWARFKSACRLHFLG